MSYLILFLLFLMYITPSKPLCTPCKCTKFPLFAANCGVFDAQVDLTNIPDNLPAEVALINMTRQSIETLTNNMLQKYTNLYLLSFCSNIIDVIEPNVFKNLTKLTNLALNTNQIASLPDGVFSDLKKLDIIQLNYNRIVHLQKGLFYNLTELRTILLHNNEITSIDEGCFYNLPSLKSVDLGFNKLKYLSPNVIDNTYRLLHFSLDNNLWDCNIDLCPLIRIMNNIGKQKLICSSPEFAENKTWLTVKYEFEPKVILEKYDVEKGDNVDLQCQYCFAENITWKYNDIILKDALVKVNSNFTVSILSVNNVQENKEGKYSCYVKQDMDKTSITMLQITPKKPIITSNLSGIEEKIKACITNRFWGIVNTISIVVQLLLIILYCAFGFDLLNCNLFRRRRHIPSAMPLL